MSRPVNTTTTATMSNRRWWIWITLITLAGLAVRVAYILIFRTGYLHGILPGGAPYVTRVWGDGLVYHKQANLLVDGMLTTFVEICVMALLLIW